MNTITKQTSFMDASKRTAAFGGGYFKTLLTLFILFLSVGVWGQTTFSWRNDQNPTSGQWNVSNYWWNGSAAALPGGGEILFIDGSVGTTMTNDLPSTNRHKITFGSTNTPAARTIGGSSTNTFFEFGSTWPRIQNDATNITHTINFPIAASTNAGFNLELAANSGALVFGGTLNTNGRTIQIYGNNSAIDATNRFVRLGGIVSGAGALNVSQFGSVRLNATHTYTGQTTIDNGELWIESAGSIASLSSIFVGNGGQLTNVAKFWLSNSSGGTTFSRSITINNGNAATRFLGGLNTSGTHTFSGAITNNSTTGGLYLSALNSGGTTTFSGIISGGGALLVDGAGTVILSGSNTYTGGTRILSGTLSASSAANFGNTSGAITLGNGSTTGTLNITSSLTRTALNVTDASSAGVINVAASQIFTLTNLNTASGTNNTTKIGKSGPGTLTLSGAGTYVGQIQVGDGTVIVSNNAGLGTNNSTTARGIDLGLNVGDVSLGNNVSVLAINGITVPQSIYVAPNTSSATRTIGLSGGSGTATFNNEIYLDGNLTVSGTGTVVLSGRLTNTGGVISNATIVNLQHNANNYSGSTTINSGSELRLNPSSNATFASQIVLNGGTLGTTGITATRTWTSSSTLNVTANSTISLLASTAHTLTFAASDAVSWTAGATLNITGWSGNYDGTAGTGGRIFIGSNASGLTATQLSHITFFNGTNYYQATLLSTGELVPTATIAALYWGGSGTWTSANTWSLTSGGTLNQTWASGRAAIFNVANSTITGGTTNVSSITANENVTFTSGGTLAFGASGTGIAEISVASGKIFNLGGQGLTTSSTAGYIKNGSGTIQITGSTFAGGVTLNDGMIAAGGVNAMGAGGSLTINGGTIAGTANRTFTGKFTGGINIGGDFTLGSFNSPALSTATLLFDNATSLGSNTTRTITLGGIGVISWNGIISGTNSNLIINSSVAGTLSLGAANIYTGYTRINGGTLTLGINNAIPVALTGGGVIFGGGTLNTGAARSEGVSGSTNMGTLTLLENSSLVFGSPSTHNLYFAASDAVAWTAGKTLAITGWNTSNGTNGSGGKIFVGNSASGLTSSQLAQITINGLAVTQLSTGEIVPKPVLYRSKQTGLWSDVASWETSTDEITWINATVAPSYLYGTITIRNTHTITVNSLITIDQVLIEAGGTLNINNASFLINNGDGNDLDVNGTLINSLPTAYTISSGANIIVQNGGVYRHAGNGGSLPTITWASGSTCEVTGITNTMLTSGLSQSFSNFTWNCTGQSIDVTFGLATWTISGNLKISSTGTKSWSVGNSSFAATMNAGSFLIEGGSFYVAGASASQIMTFNITNNATQTGGIFDIGRSNSNSGICNVGGNFTTSGGITRVHNNSGTGGIVSTLTITGDVSVEGGSIDLDPTSAGSNVGRLFVKGNLSLSSGGLLYTRGATGPVTTGPAGIYFDGPSSQTFTHSGGTLSTESGGIGRRFYYKTTSGPTINEEYSASSAQTTVNGSEGTSIPAGYGAWPTSGSRINNLTINNSAGVTLSTAKQVNGTLTLTSGKLTTNGNVLTLVNSSTGSSSSYVVADATGSVTMNAVSSAKTIPIGTATDYTPITVSSNSSTNYSTYVSSTLPCTVGNADAVVNLAWNINGSNAPSNVVFQWNSGNQGSAFNPANSCEVGQYGSTCPYAATTIGVASGSGPYTLSVSSGLVTGNNIYSIGNLNSILPAGPTLTPVVLTSALSATYGSVSSGVSFTASGTNLTANITATAQTGYEVSESQSSGYGSSVSVASGTTIWVRLAATQAVGNYNNGTAVVLSSTGATDVNVITSASGNTVSKATPTITSSPTASTITYGQTLASSTLSGGTASVAGSFAFTSPSTAPIAGTANQNVTFTPADNTNYNTTNTDVSVTVNKANQTITFGALADKTTADAPFALTGTANSGLDISYSSSNIAVATIAGSTVTIVGAGQTTITASQPGDDNFNAATSVDQTLTVTIPACVTNSNQTGGWNFATVSPSTTVSNITIGDLSQGNNNGTTTLISSTAQSSVYTGASGGNNAGAAARIGALNTGASGSAYFEFTLTPANGYNFTLTGISFGSRSSSTGPQAYALRSSLDSYATDIATGSLTNNSTWALSSNTGLNTAGLGYDNPIIFRLYGYNGSGSAVASTANWRIDDLTLTVTVSNAPSAASVGSTQNLCDTLTSTALGGNTPLIGTGTWSQTSGPGTTTFSAINSGSSTATASVIGAYVYKWSISNGCATVNEASVTVNYNSTPSAPTASAQSFCSAASPTVASLVASGTAIQWYAASTGGSSLSSSTALSSGSYYASQTVSGCESTTRTTVAITVNTNPSAPTASAQSFCSATSPTVASLVATGTGIQWYDASTNGNLLASETALSSGTYYVSQTVNGCESTTRTAATVTVNPNGTWLGGNGSWNNATNWCGGIPTASTNVVISNGNPILDVNHTLNSGSTLTLSGTASLTINPNAILTIAGSADFGGKSVTLKSDATGTAAIGQVTGSLTGATNVTVERYIPAKRAWRALTAPLKGSNTSLYASWQNGGVSASPFNTGVELWGPSGTGMVIGPAYNIRQYTTSGWADVTNTQSANLFSSTANNAYMVFVTGGYGSNNIGNGQSAATTLKATGQLITGTVNYSLSSTNHTLIGNPYASPISPELILANTANTNTALLFPYLWVWNPAYNTNGAYELYDKVAGTYSGGNLSAGTAIQSGQAFFVRTETASSSLTLTESMKSSSISNTFRNSNSITPSIVRASFLKQTALDWMPLDGCIAAFYEGANAAADDADGKKMINSGENIGFVRNAVNLSSEHYPLVTNQDILNLKIWNTQQARYKLKLNTEEFTMTGVEAYLQDLYTGTTQPLNLDGSVQEYEFDVDPTVSASSGNRFRIVFTNIGLAVTDPEQGQLSIYPNPVTGGKVTVSLPTGTFEGCSYELINVLGQVVRQDQIANGNSSQVLISVTGLPTAWYALRIRKDNKVVYQGKLIINN